MRKGRWLASTKRWLSRIKSNSAASSPSFIASAAKSCSSAIPPTLLPPKKLTRLLRDREQQGARSFGLQAALALAKLYQSTARPVEARAVLAPALEGFSPTPEMPEIAEALSLSARLA